MGKHMENGPARPALVHAALALGGFAIGTTEFATMSFLPAFTHDLGVDVATGGHVVSSYALGVVVGAPLLAVVGARVEQRRLLLMLMTWFGLGNLASALAPTITSLAMLRFLTALPHGGYFGTAVLIAARLVQARQQGQAIGRVLMGLAFATVTGVPLANLFAQWLGWRSGFAALGVLSLITVLLLYRVVPRQTHARTSTVRTEVDGLRHTQVWMTLGMGAVGFGGLFAVYTYLASTLASVTKASAICLSLILALFGAGIVAGTTIAPHIAKRGTLRAAGMFLGWSALALAFYPLVIANVWATGLAVFMIGVGGGLGTVLQMRLMEVAGNAQGMAAALNHAAFNIANALGPWVGGLAISAGYGWASTGWVGCALASGGLVLWLVTMLLAKPRRVPQKACM